MVLARLTINPGATRGRGKSALTNRGAALASSPHGVSGTVENTGGEAAHDVTVAVHVTSPAQGEHCLDDEIDVAAELKPGEKAEFSGDFDHPCFRGETSVDLRPQWQ